MQQARERELQVVYEGRAVAFEEIVPAAKRRTAAATRKPAANHPWRQSMSLKKRAATGRAMEMTGRMESVENLSEQRRGFARNNRFPTLPTVPWKSLKRFPHSHSPDDDTL